MLHRQLTSPFFFFNDTATTEIYTLSLHDALPISSLVAPRESVGTLGGIVNFCNHLAGIAAPIVTGYIVKATNSFSRSEEHTSELQSRLHLVCRLLLEKKNNTIYDVTWIKCEM